MSEPSKPCCGSNDKTLVEIIAKYRGWVMFEGILLILLGILAVALPQLFTVALELILGWLLIAAGIVQGVRGFLARNASGFFVTLASGLIYITIGLLLVAYPLKGALTLTILLMTLYFVQGIAQILLGTRYSSLKRSAWLIVSGFVTLLLALVIWTSLPDGGSWILGLLAGVNLIFFGFSLMSIACASKKAI